MRIKRIQKLYRFVFRFTRSSRLNLLRRTFPLTPSTRVLDLGGTFYIWSTLEERPQVTVLNVSDRMDRRFEQEHTSLVIGDATDVDYPDRSFDLVFSNSVIEHVGDYSRQQAFAREARRVGRGVFVQTPAKEFFLEPHLLAPFIHWLPKSWQRKLIGLTPGARGRNWTAEEQQDFLDNVRLLTGREFRALFPDCEIHVERLLGMPRSYIAIRRTESIRQADRIRAKTAAAIRTSVTPA